MLEEKIIGLKKQLIEYASILENMIDNSIKGLKQKNLNLLNEIINCYEPQINKFEIEIDELCINIIAQYAPKGKDLRIIVMTLKMNKDFERIGDHVVNIIQSGIFLIERPVLKPFIDVLEMSQTVRKMFNDSITSFITENTELAKNVCERDKMVDSQNLSIIKELISIANLDNLSIEKISHIIRISHNFERIADLSTNICEDVIYLTLGKDIKHKKDEETEKIKVLFVCSHNSARSQIAEAFLKKLGGNRFDVMSAGLEPGNLNPIAIEVMKEIGIDISGNKTKSVFDLYKQGLKFHYIITVCDKSAAEKCPIFPGLLTKTIHWNFEDISTFQGNYEEKLEQARKLRDKIKSAVELFIKENSAFTNDIYYISKEHSF